MRPYFPPEDCGHAVLVGHRVDAFETQFRVAVHRRAPAPARDHDVTGHGEIVHHLAFHDADGAWARGEPPALAHGNPARHEPRLAYGIERVPDRFRGRPQVGIVRMTERLRDHRDDRALHAGALQRVLERLLDHVSHPPCRAGHQHAQRQRRDLISRDLVPRELIAHLRSVAVNEHDVPAGGGEIDDGRETGAGMTELIADGRPLIGWGDGVPSEGDDDGSRVGHGGAT